MKRVSLPIPEEVLERMDYIRRSYGITRSLLAEMILDECSEAIAGLHILGTINIIVIMDSMALALNKWKENMNSNLDVKDLIEKAFISGKPEKA